MKPKDVILLTIACKSSFLSASTLLSSNNKLRLSPYDELTKSIEDIREQRLKLLESADLPLPELSVENGELVYRGNKWDNMSGSEQLKVATAIVRKLNPNCGFVLMDKLEQMDQDTLNEFGKWLEQEQLQVIATRVSSGKELSLIHI